MFAINNVGEKRGYQAISFNAKNTVFGILQTVMAWNI